MSTMASRITSLAIVYSTVYSGADQRKTSKLRVTGPCAGNSPVTGEFIAQRASNAENASIWWRHHALDKELNWQRPDIEAKDWFDGKWRWSAEADSPRFIAGASD